MSALDIRQAYDYERGEWLFGARARRYVRAHVLSRSRVGTALRRARRAYLDEPERCQQAERKRLKAGEGGD